MVDYSRSMGPRASSCSTPFIATYGLPRVKEALLSLRTISWPVLGKTKVGHVFMAHPSPPQNPEPYLTTLMRSFLASGTAHVRLDSPACHRLDLGRCYGVFFRDNYTEETQ